MQKYFIDDNDFNTNSITSSDAFHICKVMRSKVGDNVLIGHNLKTYLVELTSIKEKIVTFDIKEELDINNELPVNVHILQGYPKGDKFEDIIKHGVELGAYEFTPVLTSRTQFNVDEKRKVSKIERFNKISKEAAEQSNRALAPLVNNFTKLKDIDFSLYDYIFVCFEESAKNGEYKEFKALISNIKVNSNIAFIIGPEGGLAEEEVNYLIDKGAKVGALGKRILRTETVVFYVLSSISYEMELTK